MSDTPEIPPDEWESREEEGFSVQYIKSDEYQMAPVTGVRGGRQPSGGLKFDFMLDYNEVPKEDVYSEDFEFIDRHGGVDIHRVLQFSIFIDEGNAQEIGLFLLAHSLGVEINRLIEVLSENFEDFEFEPIEAGDEQ